MAKYDILHVCGHTSRVALIGPRSSREWRIERLQERLCDDCWQAKRDQERARQNSAAAAANREMELPALRGTDKQIGWGETIRLQILRSVEEYVDLVTDIRDDPRLPNALDAIYQEDRAHWWIDSRYTSAHTILHLALRTEHIAAEQAGTAGANSDAAAEATVRPETVVTETVAEIRVAGNIMQIVFAERRDDFRQLMRETLRCRWTGSLWQRTMDLFSGTVQDRAAEAGHRLLAAGFPIRIYDADVLARAIAGDYAPECRRWVSARTKDPHLGWFGVRWPKSDNLYRAAKRLPGSRYAEGQVHVPPEQYEQVLDFAERYRFQLTPGARKLAEEARIAREKALMVRVEPPPEPERVLAVAGRVPARLEVPEEVGVADALRDD